MKKKKGFVSLALIGIIAVASMLVLALTPIGSSISSLVLQIPVPCELARYNPNCICGEGFKKIGIISGGGWTCESEDSVLNPESGNYDEEAINYAKQKLIEAFPECDSVECPEPAEITVVWGQEWSGNRVALVECTDRSQGITFWTINPDIEDGSFTRANCIDYYEKPVGENTASLRIDNVYAWDGGTKIQIEGYFASPCEYQGTAEASVVYTLPETRGDFISFYEVPSFCTVSMTSRAATITCTRECGAGGGGSLKLKAEIAGTYCLAQDINGNTIKFGYGEIVCIEEGEYLTWRCYESTIWRKYSRDCLNFPPFSAATVQALG